MKNTKKTTFLFDYKYFNFTDIENLQVMTELGYDCDFSFQSFGHNYSTCSSDYYSYGDGQADTPWCRYHTDTHGGESSVWDSCRGIFTLCMRTNLKKL